MSPDGARILIVDDETQIRRLLNAALASHRYGVLEAATGQEAISQAALHHPDAIILDLGLPDMDGVEVVRRLREWTQTPIVILSVREDERDKIEALDAGADDYVTKPFLVGEVLARLRVGLRRVAKEEEEGVLTSGEITVDSVQHLITVRGQKVKLSVTEYEILKYLVSRKGKVVAHAQLLGAVRGPGHGEDAHYLRVYIAQLRHKIEEDPNHPRYIMTEPGVGYRMVERE